MNARKLPSGSWNCKVFSHYEEISQADGTIKKKRIYQSFTCDVQGPRGKRLCEKMAAEWAASKEQRTKVEDITFGEAVSKYIASRETVLSPRTVSSYKQIQNTDLSSLSDIKLSRITQDDIQNLINQKSLTLSPKTVRNIHGLISAVLSKFRPDFVIHTALPKKVRPDIYVPKDAEIRRLMDIVKDTEMELPILLAAFGPMRRGEICALHSDNISGNIVHVCENMVQTHEKEWIIKSPKSYAGDRYIDYPDFVAEKWKGISGRIVNLAPNVVTNRFTRLLKANGLPHFRFHDLRHYSASIMHAIGIPDAYIMQRGGWGNDGVLKSVYRHAMEDKQKEMTDKANEHFSDLCNTTCNMK